MSDQTTSQASRTGRFLAWLSRLPNLVVAAGVALLFVEAALKATGGDIEPSIVAAAGTIIAGGLAASSRQENDPPTPDASPPRPPNGTP